MLHPELFQRLCHARDLLREPNPDPRTVAAVARQAGFSPFHFIRLFKAVFGETPHQCRSRAQIERARHLLVLTDWSVTEVCLEVGFTSLGSFSALFTRRVGLSPSAFQRKHATAAGSPRRLPPALIPGCISLMGAAYAQISNFEEAPAGRVC